MNSISGAKLYSWYQQAKQSALANNIDPDEVDWLLQVITNLSNLSIRLGSYANQSFIVSQRPLWKIEELWQRRLQERVPVQYLVNTVFWRRFQLRVTPAVLIPRPETELIIDIAIEAAGQNKNSLIADVKQHWVDLGTGSGAIALGLASSLPQATIHAVDYSPEALGVAQENAEQLNLNQNICFYQGSWWQPLEFLQGQVRGMVSNPPYIPTSQISQLQPEVANHEPHLALDGGIDGLNDIRHLVQVAPHYLISGGIWLIEIMAGQHHAVVKLLEQQEKYYDIKIFPDLSGIERFVLAHRR
ncbi:peptide chain release factor N(5)-glutamine methyltransferase [Pleurocapsa sp. PCC 7319]|uniref:peptide chain release factor N(5)-glutamine methyltransferase n=1 Tax=Pleurocapsa sp. PCC 7319 TaxID=118161 RepID=UPI000346D170|nr:peptide chain release factor N(5)-glutamine methyltransferase [Pleurocapsa sp. PCC 7319]